MIFRIIGIVMMSCLALTSIASHGFRSSPPTTPMLTAEQFPILPWGWTLGDAQALDDIKACGFNLAGFVAPQDVALVREAGLQCIVDDPELSGAISNSAIEDTEITRRVEAVASRFKDDPAVFGYYLMDEPTVDWYPNLARWRVALAKADPDGLAYINLLPVGAQGPGVKDYEEYLSRYIDTVKPGYVSYDHYTLKDDGSVASSLYLNLELVRAISQNRSIPFWNIILANSHFRYASPTPAGLRLQVFATLAYGGGGISYFTYFAPVFSNFRESAVDQFLNKTPTWDMIRNINLQIHNLGPTYLQLKSVNVFHYPQAPEGCTGGPESSRFLSEISGERELLVGEFEHDDGRPFVMIVNKDIRTSTAFNVTFKQPGAIMETSPYTGETTRWDSNYNFLAPGQGILLSVGE